MSCVNVTEEIESETADEFRARVAKLAESFREFDTITRCVVSGSVRSLTADDSVRFGDVVEFVRATVAKQAAELERLRAFVEKARETDDADSDYKGAVMLTKALFELGDSLTELDKASKEQAPKQTAPKVGDSVWSNCLTNDGRELATCGCQPVFRDITRTDGDRFWISGLPTPRFFADEGKTWWRTEPKASKEQP